MTRRGDAFRNGAAPPFGATSLVLDRADGPTDAPGRAPRPVAAPLPGRARWCFFSPGLRALRVLSGDSRTAGGAEAQVAHIAAALAARGHDVSLIYGDGHGAAPPVTLAGVACIDAVPDWRRPKSLLALWRVVTRLAPDVLYARLPSDFFALAACAARRRSRVRVVYALAHDLHARAWSAYDHRRWFHAPLYALGLRCAHGIAIQHAHQRAALAPTLRARSALVPNLVRTVGTAPRDYGATRYDAVWVAKIRSEKRLDRLLDLAEASPHLSFAVVGGYDPLLPAGERTDLACRAAALANVTMLGELRARDVLDVIALGRVLLNTSDAEGFPNTMLEAWSLGVPVASLGVDPGGVIVRERLGLVARSTHALGAALARLARNEDLNLRCGTRGQDYVRRIHAQDVVCDRLATLCLQPGVDLPRAGGELLP